MIPTCRTLRRPSSMLPRTVHVLLAVDGSKQSRASIEFASRYLPPHSRITVLNVVDTGEPESVGFYTPTDKELQQSNRVEVQASGHLVRSISQELEDKNWRPIQMVIQRMRF